METALSLCVGRGFGVGRDSCYAALMAKPLENILEQVAGWPEEAQAELLQSIADIEKKFIGNFELTPEIHAAIEVGLDDVRNGRFATDAEMEALFARSRQ
jgi:hypothetical protein